MDASFWKCLSKEDLKLKRTMTFENVKKIANTFSEMLGVEDIYTRLLHLEGKKVFVSNKRKLDLSINS